MVKSWEAVNPVIFRPQDRLFDSNHNQGHTSVLEENPTTFIAIK
jgi:hypothetical protein